MAHGDNHAKRIVINEATRLANKLQNGGAECTKTQGEAMALVVKMITPLYEAEFVTVKECERVHRRSKGNKKRTRIKIGPFEIEGFLNPSVIVPIACCALCLFTLGRVQNWW